LTQFKHIRPTLTAKLLTRCMALASGAGLTLAMMVSSAMLSADEARPASLAGIMSVLASVQGADATFLETRESAFLTSGLKSEGRVTWRAPSTLTKETLEPFEETVSVDGGEIKLSRTDDGRTRGSVISIDDHPEACIRETFKDDRVHSNRRQRCEDQRVSDPRD